MAKEVLNTGVKIGADVISGNKNLKESAKENISTARKKVADTVLKSINEEEDSSEEEIVTEFKKPVKRKKVKYNTNSVKRTKKEPEIVI